MEVFSYTEGKKLPTPDLFNDLSEILKVTVEEILNAGEINETINKENITHTVLRSLKEFRIFRLFSIKNNDSVANKIRKHKKEKINNRIPVIKSIAQTMIDGY